MIRGIASVEDRCAKSAAETLEVALDRAKAGEVVGVTLLLELRGGNIEVMGGEGLSRIQTIGALFEMAFERANQRIEQ